MVLQLTSKFTTCVIFCVCSSILFEVLVSTRILDASEEIAHVVLLASLDFIVSVSRGSLRELTYKRCEMASKRVQPPLET